MDTNLQKYIALIETIDLGSFTKAAEKLNYSQSGISRMINDLEKEWNISLLERNKSGLTLTSDGKFLYPYIKNLNDDYQKLNSVVDGLHGLQSGTIRIGTFSSVATHWLPKIMNAFKKDYPKIEFELLLGDYHEIENWIVNGRVDLGFVRNPTLNEFDTIYLEDDPLMAVLPADYPINSAVFDIDNFNNSNFILLDKNKNSDITSFFEKYNIVANTQFTTWDDYAVMSMVESGLGISILPKLILKRTSYKIISLPLSQQFHREIVIAMKDQDTLSLASQKFLNYLDYRNK
ncbi:LysR family transcriptional regulator [Companilactobacillus baiquanensis]|uniref:LysR family transcriptional regulator n=1 Tax=Companilactobacillus baiquanensis TaxID=2486005 RepID=A0ABW1URJ7_9LACO|nr:LysR family transcriptional regulator [Companilactobacillus baiquanensis]